jgi:lycopene cyclase domain-containing protein
MTYTALAVTVAVGCVTLDLFVVRTGLVRRGVFWLSYLIIVAFQLVVNGLLTGYRVVVYDPSTITGLRVVHAPVEDLAFGFALTLTTLMSWVGRPAGSNRHRKVAATFERKREWRRAHPPSAPSVDASRTGSQ